MIRKLVMALALCSFPLSALGQWNAGAHYLSLSDSEGGSSIDLGVVAGSVGYAVLLQDGWSLNPELRYGLGVQKHSTSRVLWQGDEAYQLDVTTRIKRFVTLSLKAQYDFDFGLYLFAGPTYNHLKSSATLAFVDFPDEEPALVRSSDTELGYGLGAGYQLTPEVSAELQYESFDSKDAMNLGLRFRF